MARPGQAPPNLHVYPVSNYQPVKFDVARIIADKSSMALVVDGQRQPISIPGDAALAARPNQPASVTAPLVFIGYGLHLPESNYDDFDSPEAPRASLKGKIVVLAGALGSIRIPTPKSMDFPWARVASSCTQPGMPLAPSPSDDDTAARHPALADQRAPMFLATFNPAEAGKLFAGKQQPRMDRICGKLCRAMAEEDALRAN